MAVTVSSFTTRYPEFAAAPPAQVQSCLDDAVAALGGAVNGAAAWGLVFDQAVSLRAAHALALSPIGSGLQLGVRRDPSRNDTTDAGSTVYEEQFLRLRAGQFCGALVA